MFYCLFVVESHKMVQISTNLNDSLSAIFWAQNTPFLIQLTCTKSIFTNFYHLLPNFTNFCHFLSFLCYFYQLLQLFATILQLLWPYTFYYLITFPKLLPTSINFYPLLLFASKKCFYFFSFFCKSCDMQQSHHLAGCHATGTNSMLIFLLQVLRCLYLGVITKPKN